MLTAVLLASELVTSPLFRLWIGLAVLAMVVRLLLAGKEGRRCRRLARLYPAMPRSGGNRVWGDLLMLGRTKLRNSTWLHVDDDHLHVYPVLPMGALRPPFSVPLEEISVDPATSGWISESVVRLTFARAPEEPIMLPPRTFGRVATASAGKVGRVLSG